MEDRAFREVSVVATHAQLGNDRFPRPERESNPPPALEFWRCNLTGLSHNHNLYFVAARGLILVYEPTFPDQALSSRPSLILDPLGSSDYLYGNTNNPLVPTAARRSVNHLIVEFLGLDEIMLVALHDGHVVGYRVSDVQQAIEKRSEPDCVESNIGDDVRPFFKEHLGVSAWGLAVHREARMIAASANTHRVTIWAYALTKDATPGSASYWGHRTHARRIVLPDTGENIPSIAFCNTGDDPAGRWLLSSDINGVTRLFDLALGADHGPVEEHAHKFCALAVREDRRQCGCHSLDGGYRYYLHATWGVMWLDRRAFKKTENLDEALDYNHEGYNNNIEQSYAFYDCSQTTRSVRNASSNYIPYQAYPVSLTHLSDQELIDLGYHPGVPEMHESGPIREGVNERGQQIKRKPFNLANEIHLESAYSQQIPASPILRVSVKDVFLLQSRDREGNRNPAIGFHDPLFQQTYQFSELDEAIVQDRINLFAQIPELGLVIVASAKGRAAIMSLTQCPENPSRTRNSEFVERSSSERWYICGCRVDHIVPFKHQEQARQRPETALVGVAVGPIQGMLGRHADYSRRWRLLLTYADNSILSYELGKFRDERVSIREFDDLVV
ncbi:uncharacterized protein K452DRAFT_355533 [Aplosporella prunicola CBS 121167]|uniref:Uncharacterized protein n=1 Tax=Aplosporella prunicola CBS 121167 TaxID=1176127 RepID=A0A6A6BS64_9PEZI|nr:uncharacterized protein K452DRAFT_355533 [Aplosporella prunicola CBS 121167]KAF2146064.1 hypothetical protein K452DRAFT_355533 [Aplosporella prunicola CBS 121167]